MRRLGAEDEYTGPREDHVDLTPGQMKKLQATGMSEEPGWGVGFFGKAINIIEKVGDVVGDIVAPTENDEECIHQDRLSDILGARSPYETPLKPLEEASQRNLALGSGNQMQTPGDHGKAYWYDIHDNDSSQMSNGASPMISSPGAMGMTPSPVGTPANMGKQVPSTFLSKGDLGLSVPTIDSRFLKAHAVEPAAQEATEEKTYHKAAHDNHAHKTHTTTTPQQQQQHAHYLDHTESSMRHYGDSSKVEASVSPTKHHSHLNYDHAHPGHANRHPHKEEEDKMGIEESAVSLTNNKSPLESEGSLADRVEQAKAQSEQAKAQSDSYRLVIEQQDHEIMRLNAALQQSEDLLKETEEATWQAKAYQSELMYAMEADKESLATTVAEKQRLQEENEHLKGQVGSLKRQLGQLADELDMAKATMNSALALEERNSNSPLPTPAETSAEGGGEKSEDWGVTSVQPLVDTELLQETMKQKSSLESELRRLKAEYRDMQDRHSILHDELQIERNDKEDARGHSDRLQFRLQEINGELTSLQTAVSQLKLQRNTAREEAEQFQQERNELRDKLNNLSQAWTRDSQQLHKVASQREEDLHYVEEMKSGIEAVEREKQEMSDKCTAMQEQLDVCEKANYDLTVLCDGLQSDLIIARQDAEDKGLQLINLDSVIAKMSREREEKQVQLQQLQHTQSQHEKEVSERQVQELEAQYTQKLAEQTEELQLAMQQAEDAELLRRKALMDLHQEKLHFAAKMDSALNQLRNDTGDSVDRNLMANLIVSYFKQSQSRDIMTLISKILHFDEDQKVAVGLAVPKINLVKSLMSTLQKMSKPDPASAAKMSELQGDNLAELWVSYLAAESGVDVALHAGGSGGTSGSPVVKKNLQQRSSISPAPLLGGNAI